MSYGAIKPSEDRSRRPWEARSRIPLQDRPNGEGDDLNKLRVQVDWISGMLDTTYTDQHRVSGLKEEIKEIKNDMEHVVDKHGVKDNAMMEQLWRKANRIKNIVQSNIEKVERRGENIELLGEKAAILEEDAAMFERGATRVAQSYENPWWKTKKFWIVFIIICIIIILFLLAAIIIPIVVLVLKKEDSN